MGVSWLKTGAESAQMQKQYEQEKERRKQEAGKMWRFWLKHGAEGEITFVDGQLDSQGFLLPPRFYEHQVYLAGSWNNFYVCPEKTNPQSGDKCPICAGGDKPSMVSVFTVIDHSEYTRKDGSVSKDVPKLFVAKDGTYQILAKKAQKHDGLAGVRFSVSRIGDKAASVGTMFEFVSKTPVDVLQKQYLRQVQINGQMKTVSLFTPADYDKEFVFKTGEELLAEGFGKPAVTGMAPQGMTPSGSGPDSGGFEQHL